MWCGRRSCAVDGGAQFRGEVGGLGRGSCRLAGLVGIPACSDNSPSIESVADTTTTMNLYSSRQGTGTDQTVSWAMEKKIPMHIRYVYTYTRPYRSDAVNPISQTPSNGHYERLHIRAATTASDSRPSPLSWYAQHQSLKLCCDPRILFAVLLGLLPVVARVR